jgi:hypothetical protein
MQRGQLVLGTPAAAGSASCCRCVRRRCPAVGMLGVVVMVVIMLVLTAGCWWLHADAV